MKFIPKIFIVLLLAGGIFSSCHYNPVVIRPCDTCSKPCDTCNLNQDSLTRVRDSLSHAFTWKELTIPGQPPLSGCWVFGDNDIYVLGSSLWHYDGATFTLVNIVDRTHNTMLNGALADDQLFAFSKSDFWITSYGGEALHTSDGKNCDDFRFGGVNACWGTSSNDMYFVGHGGLIWHYDGVKFDAMTSNTNVDLGKVWGTSDNNIWACGSTNNTGETAIIHYDGTSWSKDPLSNSDSANQSSLQSTWAVDSSMHELSVASGSFLFRKKDNGIWQRDYNVPNLLPDSISHNRILYLTGNSATDFWCGGWSGWTAHWNGKTWKRYDSIYDPKNILFSSGSMSAKGNSVCIVGTKNNSTSWVAIGTRK